MAGPTFVSRRDSAFRAFPPASAQTAVVIPFFGDLTVWVWKSEETGWQFPASRRRSGETIVEVARRELWCSTRLVADKLELLGAVREEGETPSTSYVYMCDIHRLPWSYAVPEADDGVSELAVFGTLPAKVASPWSEVLLETAQKARRSGLR
jgi:8-oxo-dGTP pyrophosphatase MutT (NUDIX family)